MGEDARLIGGNQMFSEVEFVGKEEIVCEKNGTICAHGDTDALLEDSVTY